MIFESRSAGVALPRGLCPASRSLGWPRQPHRGIWDEPEAQKFARVARRIGVPEESMLSEDRSTNTGENVLFTRQLLLERGLDPERFILVQKRYMERRTYATFRKL